MQVAKKLILASAIALAGTGVAQARTVIYADIEPPALRAEVVPAPRVGYVWVEGHYVRDRHGYRYRPARWEHHGHRWRYYDGGWDR